MRDSLEYYDFSRDVDKDDDYFKNFRGYFNSPDFLEQQQKPASSEITKLLRKKKILLLEKLINKENSALLLTTSGEYTSTSQEPLIFLLDEQNSFAQKSITFSPLRNLVNSIKNNKIESLASKVKEYTGIEIRNTKPQLMYSVLYSACRNAVFIWGLFFDINSFLIPWFIFYLNILFLTLIVTILCLFKSSYRFDFWISLLYTIPATIFIQFVTISSYSFLLTDSNTLFLISIFVGLPCLFVLYRALKPSKKRIYSRFKVLNLGAAPFAVVILLIFLRFYYYNKGWIPKIKNGTDGLDFIIYFCIYIILLYLPFLSLIKNKLIQQLSLPKE